MGREGGASSGLKPTWMDYIAGGSLASGMVLIWSYMFYGLLSFMGITWEEMPALNKVLLYGLSIFFYALVGFLAARLVCKRASSSHLLIGFRVALLAGAISSVIMPKNTLFDFLIEWAGLIIGGCVGGILS